MPQTLDDHHAALERHMAECDFLLKDRDPAAAPLLNQKFGQALLMVTAYQSFVHRTIFAPLSDHDDPSKRARVNELKVECIALTEDLRAHTHGFMTSGEGFDLASFGTRVAWFNRRVRRHLADVRLAMSPELTDAEHAALRARRTGAVGVRAA